MNNLSFYEKLFAWLIHENAKSLGVYNDRARIAVTASYLSYHNAEDSHLLYMAVRSLLLAHRKLDINMDINCKSPKFMKGSCK